MPTPTYTLISSSTVGSGGTTSIDFTSIPGTYTDLLISCSLRNSGTNSDCYLTVNGSGGSDRWVFGYGNGMGATSGTRIYIESCISSQTANTFSNSQIYIPNYTTSVARAISTDTVTENNAVSNMLTLLSAGLSSSSSAVTSLSLVVLAGSFVQYSTAYLYGIVKS
jgi:hypothetical protein